MVTLEHTRAQKPNINTVYRGIDRCRVRCRSICLFFYLVIDGMRTKKKAFHLVSGYITIQFVFSLLYLAASVVDKKKNLGLFFFCSLFFCSNSKTNSRGDHTWISVYVHIPPCPFDAVSTLFHRQNKAYLRYCFLFCFPPLLPLPIVNFHRQNKLICVTLSYFNLLYVTSKKNLNPPPPLLPRPIIH